MAKSKSSKTRTVYRAKTKSVRHKKKEVIHLVPDLLEVGVLYPALTSSPDPTIGDYVLGKLRGEGTAPVGDYISNTVGNYKANIVPVIALGLGGLAVKWLGKKTGLSKIGTKRVKVF